MSDTEKDSPAWSGWAVLELMGHRKLAGQISECTIGGAAFVRIDVPGPLAAGPITTQFYSPSAVYCITPTTEDIARRVAEGCLPAPVQRWELPPVAEENPEPSNRYDGIEF